MESDAHEIVENIGKALAQAQQLREKAANNIVKYKQKAREPDVETIYTANKKNVGKKSKTVRDEKTSTESANLKITEISASNKELSGAKKSEVMAKKSTDLKSKTLIRLPNNIIPSSSAEILKTKKNFLAVNKANIKNMKRDQKSLSNPKIVTNFAKVRKSYPTIDRGAKNISN